MTNIFPRKLPSILRLFNVGPVMVRSLETSISDCRSISVRAAANVISEPAGAKSMTCRKLPGEPSSDPLRTICD